MDRAVNPPDQAIRTRVERLLHGPVDAEYLTRIFLFARNRCDGRESVQELGDFVAHHSEREKGPLTRAAKDFLAMAEINVWVSQTGGQVDMQNLPPSFIDGLSAALRNIHPAEVRRAAKMKREIAATALKGLAAKLVKAPAGNWRLAEQLAPREREVIKGLCGTLVVKPAFDGDRLCDDLEATLRSNGLLKREEVKTFEVLRPAIQSFAFSVMHNSRLTMSDGRVATLSVTIDHSGSGHMGMLATCPFIAVNGIKPEIAWPIFVTNLRASDACDPALIAKADPWGFDLKVSSAGKLSEL